MVPYISFPNSFRRFPILPVSALTLSYVWSSKRPVPLPRYLLLSGFYTVRVWVVSHPKGRQTRTFICHCSYLVDKPQDLLSIPPFCPLIFSQVPRHLMSYNFFYLVLFIRFVQCPDFQKSWMLFTSFILIYSLSRFYSSLKPVSHFVNWVLRSPSRLTCSNGRKVSRRRLKHWDSFNDSETRRQRKKKKKKIKRF